MVQKMNNTHKLLLSLIDAMGYEVSPVLGEEPASNEGGVDAEGVYTAEVVFPIVTYKLTKRDNPQLKSSIAINKILAIHADDSIDEIDRDISVSDVLEEYENGLK